MQHNVNKAYTRWVVANLISGHLVHTGLQGTGRVSAVLNTQWSVKNQWTSAREWLSRGLTVLYCHAMRGNCDNCSYTHTRVHLHKIAHCTCKVRTKSVD